jgi:hypothetical protein
MTPTQWSLGRVLLIWTLWPPVLLAVVVGIVALGGGGSLDLLHGGTWAVVVLVLIGPPLIATGLWGRRRKG